MASMLWTQWDLLVRRHALDCAVSNLNYLTGKDVGRVLRWCSGNAEESLEETEYDVNSGPWLRQT